MYLRSLFRKIIQYLLIGIAFSIVLIIYIPPVIDFSVENPFWNGYSAVSTKLNATVLNHPLTILPRDSDSILIVIPYQKYSDGELKFIRKYVEDGGNLILLDDYGYGNQILKLFGYPVIILNKGMLIDPLFNYRNGKLPRIFRFINSTLFDDVEEIIFNHGSILKVNSRDVDIYAYSSSFSYYDEDLDGSWDSNEPQGPFPVIAGFKYGSGYIYVVTDPSILLNSMIELGDNYKFIRNMVDGRKVYIDQYHLKSNIHYIIRENIIKFMNILGGRYMLPYLTALTLIIIILAVFKYTEYKGVGYG